MGLILKIALITDSTSYLTKAEVEKYNVKVVPLPVIIDNHEYKENVDLTTTQLYEMQHNGSDFPKTSQPSIGEFGQVIEGLKAEGYDTFIVITIGSGISGFYPSVVGFANSYPDYDMYVYDSKITVRLMGYMVIAAGKMIAANYTPERIIARLDEISATTDEIFVVDDLNNLVRGGRLSNASGLVGSMLQIKPLLTFDKETYKIVSFDKVRSMKKAILKTKKLMDKRFEAIDYADDVRIIIYIDDPEMAQTLKKDLQERYPKMVVETDPFGPVMATHLGERAIGFTWMIDVMKMNF